MAARLRREARPSRQRNRPRNLLARPSVTAETVESIDQDLRQRVRAFEGCDNGFRLALQGMRGKPELQVRLEPVVTKGTVSVARGPGEMGVTRTGFTAEETFDDLRLAVTLTADQFLAVSALDPKGNPFSVGTLWLSDRDGPAPKEMVLVFVPITVAAK